MNGLLKLAPMLLLLISVQSVEGQSESDSCHVYAVDVLTAQRAFERFQPSGDDAKDRKALEAGTTIVGTFSTRVGEEVLTTKTYRLPSSRLIVTASVFYTDESMPRESILVGLAISEKPEADAIGALNNAVAEAAYDDHFAVVRVKRLAIIEGRRWLVGLECRKRTGK
jgi:hypothetical protein